MSNVVFDLDPVEREEVRYVRPTKAKAKSEVTA